jgi:hypothetical protein
VNGGTARFPYFPLGTGAGWPATVLLVDAVISPAGTGLVYLGTSARLPYAIGEEELLPDQLTQVNRRGVPLYSVLLAFVVGEWAFLPFPNWSSLVGLVTGATAIMYAFAPVVLAALQDRDPGLPRPYRIPAPGCSTRSASSRRTSSSTGAGTANVHAQETRLVVLHDDQSQVVGDLVNTAHVEESGDDDGLRVQAGGEVFQRVELQVVLECASAGLQGLHQAVAVAVGPQSEGHPGLGAGGG